MGSVSNISIFVSDFYIVLRQWDWCCSYSLKLFAALWLPHCFLFFLYML